MSELSPSRAEDPAPVAPVDDGVVIVVCSSCRGSAEGREGPRPGSRLADAVGRLAGEGPAVKRVACLGNCGRGLTAALCRPGCWTYVFGGLSEESAEDLLAGARLFASATDALMPWRGRPEALKRGLIARVPPLDMLKDLP